MAWLKKPFKFLALGSLAAVLSVGLYAGGQALYQWAQQGRAANSVVDNPVLAASPEVETLQKTSDGFRAVSKMVGPAVVHIKVVREAPQSPFGAFRHGRPGGGRGGRVPRDPFEFFFGTPSPFGGMPEGQEAPEQEALGSGFVIDPRGYIVTNNHVVENAKELKVAFSNDDEKEITAKVVGTDPKTDLAVIKIDPPKGMKVASWADQDKVEVGDWAIAIGSPFSLKYSVTVGIVSAKGRSSRTIGSEYGNLIQTDAAINPGNSGGPLCTLRGEVMGVNTAIFSKSGGYMGIGFAIPSSIAKDVTGKLIADGKVTRGWLGVLIQQPRKELLKALGVASGVAVHRVMEDSPAEKAGLKAGDVVTEVNGESVKNVEQLQGRIALFKPGETVTLNVINSGTKKTRTVKVKIGKLPDDPQAESEKIEAPDKDAKPDKIGLVVSKVSSGKGVSVAYVQPGSPADQVQLQPGDTILSVGGKSVSSPSGYKALVSKGGMITLDVERKGERLWFQIFVSD